MTYTSPSDDTRFILHAGEMGNQMRLKDWSQTELGTADSWTPELKGYIVTMLHNPTAMSILWGPDYIQFYNDAYIPILGSLKHPCALGASCKETFEELWTDIEPIIAEGMSGRVGCYENFRVVLNRNGNFEECFFSFSISPLFNKDGRVEGVLFSTVETTDTLRGGDALKESELRFRTMSDASQVLIATSDSSGKATYFNEAWNKLTGRTSEELSDYGWADLIHQGEREVFLTIYQTAFEKKQDWKGEFRMLSKTGEYRWLLATGTALFLDNGKFTGYISSSVDITEQQLAMNSLKAQEQELTNMIVKAPIGICLLDAKTLISEVVNASFLEVAGKPYDAIAGKYYWDSFAEAKPYYEDALAGVVEKGETYYANEVELMLIRHGQEEIVYVTFVYAPLKDAEGNVKKVAVWVLENTLQVISRQKVEQSEQEIRALIESAPFPIAVYRGREMEVAFANNSILDIWGKGRDVIGKLFSEVLPELENQEVFNQLEHVYNTGTSFHVKNQRLELIVDGKNRPYYFNYSFTPLFDKEGNVYGVMNTGADVTELNIAKKKVEENERNLRNTILQAPVAMCIFRGHEHVVEIANKRMLEFWGKSETDILFKPIFEGLPEAREQGFEMLLNDVYTTGRSFSAEGIPVTLPRNGTIETVFVNFVYEAFCEPDGTISGVMAVAVDVTAQVIAHQKIEEIVAERTKELADSNENLKRSNSELGQFAYIASHDLQEPLRKISVFSQMLESAAADSLNERARGYLTKIKNSSARMTNLVRDVLSYSELNTKDDVYEEIDLSEIISGISTDYELLISQKEATITYNDLPVIKAIPLQMSQLFANLIGNALKFTKVESLPRITISASEPTAKELSQAGLPTDVKYIKLQFKDNGIGINPEYINQIFSIFKRLHRKSDFEGTGIGLAMCKKIVQNHGGEIDAIGSSAAGAVFNIYLPLR